MAASAGPGGRAGRETLRDERERRGVPGAGEDAGRGRAGRAPARRHPPDTADPASINAIGWAPSTPAAMPPTATKPSSRRCSRRLLEDAAAAGPQPEQERAREADRAEQHDDRLHREALHDRGPRVAAEARLSDGRAIASVEGIGTRQRGQHEEHRGHRSAASDLATTPPRRRAPAARRTRRGCRRRRAGSRGRNRSRPALPRGARAGAERPCGHARPGAARAARRRSRTAARRAGTRVRPRTWRSPRRRPVEPEPSSG